MSLVGAVRISSREPLRASDYEFFEYRRSNIAETNALLWLCFHHFLFFSCISYSSSIAGQLLVESIYGGHVLNKMVEGWHSIPDLVPVQTGKSTRVLGSLLSSWSALTKIGTGQLSPFRCCQNSSGSQGHSNYVVQDAEPQKDGHPGRMLSVR
jgi:hypothetical protein